MTWWVAWCTSFFQSETDKKTKTLQENWFKSADAANCTENWQSKQMWGCLSIDLSLNWKPASLALTLFSLKQHVNSFEFFWILQNVVSGTIVSRLWFSVLVHNLEIPQDQTKEAIWERLLIKRQWNPAALILSTQSRNQKLWPCCSIRDKNQTSLPDDGVLIDKSPNVDNKVQGDDGSKRWESEPFLLINGWANAQKDFSEEHKKCQTNGRLTYVGGRHVTSWNASPHLSPNRAWPSFHRVIAVIRRRGLLISTRHAEVFAFWTLIDNWNS